MASIRFEELRREYQELFDTCEIQAPKVEALDRLIARLESDLTRYQALEDRLGIPWYFIAMIHERESSGRFDRHLHNGDPLTAPTVHHPRNRPPRGGPSFTWEESAEDALKLKDLDDWTDWSVPGLLYQWERYNGFGYRKHHTPSPYLWSFSNQYQAGKYDYDGHFNPALMDRQPGAATFLRRLVDLKKDCVSHLCPDTAPPPPAPGKPFETYTYIVQAGDTLCKISQKCGLASWRLLWRANRETVLDPNLIYVGQELVIPSHPGGPSEPDACPPTSDYIMRPGDTLTQIAKIYGITLGNLFRLNPELIKPGTVIKVPKLEEEDDSIHVVVVPGQEPLWLEIAEREQGEAEFSPGDNPRIIEYLSTTAFPNPDRDEIPWCAAFVNWCICQANLTPQGSAAAVDWLHWGVGLDEPRPGCVVVFPHHVGFYVDGDEDCIQLLGGNQSNAVNIMPWRRSAALGFRWPTEVPV